MDAARALGHIKGEWENPARWKGNLVYRLPKRTRLSTGHYSAMPYEELPAFFRALRERPALAARALELTILCATRTSETLKMRWSEVDFDRATWIIPAERMKMGVEHRIPLSPAAIDILRGLPSVSNAKPSNYVFAGERGPLSQMAMTMVLRRMNLGHFTVHGMRSSFRDYMGDMTEHSESVIEQALAHQVGNEVTRAYRRKDAFDKRRIVMSDWAGYLLGQPPASVQDACEPRETLPAAEKTIEVA
ncbi:MAG: site-specific integrase [Sphingomonas sp.]|uniref:tyrosine-type recombinase/integrase n=1 Tax=Sphingomonas sp. TaxID=28214 RepID=UPI0025FC9350|nr:site-specific integrase [Sphingomonas sp.]MBX3566330.1 site-specific integrase [Sphingomonas sp.]